MAFFDKVKGFANDAASALNDAAKDVSAGAKEFSDKSKLKRTIKNEEAKMEGMYKAIGEKFYKQNVAAPMGYEQEFADIKSASAEISRLKAELDKMEASSKCPGCGAKINSGQKFCQGCGKNLG